MPILDREIERNDWVIGEMIYNFGTKKQFKKRFLGLVVQVLECNTRRAESEHQYEVSFLRKQSMVDKDGNGQYIFTYPPNIIDKWILDRDQII